MNKFDVIFEKGVFERLEKDKVAQYISVLKEKYLKDGGTIILNFLMERAKGTKFTERLGDAAYYFWRENEIRKMLEEMKLVVLEIKRFDVEDYYICRSWPMSEG